MNVISKILNNKLIGGAIYWLCSLIIAWQLGKYLSVGLFNFTVPEQYIFLGFLLIVPIALFVLLKPFWVLCILYFLSYFDQLLMIGNDITAFKVIGPIFIVLWSLSLLVKESSGRSENEIIFPFAMVPLLLFLLWGLCSYFWASYPTLALSRWIQYFMMAGFIFITVQLVKDLQKLKILLGAFILGGVTLGLLGLYQLSLNPFVRISGFGNPTDAGHYAIELLLPIFYFFMVSSLNEKRIIRFLAALVFLLFLLCGLLSGTRIFLIDIAVGISALSAYFFMLHNKRLRKKLFIFGIVSLSLFMLVSLNASLIFTNIAVYAGGFSYKNIDKMTLQKAVDDSFSKWNIFRRMEQGSNPLAGNEQADVRYAVWDVYRRGFYEYALIGIGLNNSPVYFGPLVSRVGMNGYADVATLGYADVSNEYFRILIELGVFGLAIFFIFLWYLVKRFLKVFNRVPVYSPYWFMGLLIGVNFMSLLSSAYFWSVLNRKYFWFGLALLIAYLSLAGKSVRLKEDDLS